jgi:hypothetical protein
MTKSRVIPLALLAATLGALGYLWSVWCEFPFQGWNDVRLAPAFALRHGINPYPLLNGGPLFTWIYGPVGLFVNLPATLASTPLAALQIACLTNMLTVLAPAVIIFFGSTELRSHGLMTPAFASAAAAMLVPRASLVFQVADNAAVAFGLLSCWCLARVVRLSGARLALAAALCVLAICSKQIAVFLLPAQVIFLWLASERAVAIRYVTWVGAFGLAALTMSGAYFGFENLWLNVVAIPRRLPWGELGPQLRNPPWALMARIVAPALGLVVLWRKGLWPGRDRESGRFFQIAVLASAAMLPAGVTAFFKIGGSSNSLHSWSYVFPALLFAWLARERAATRSGAIRILLAVTFVLLVRKTELLSLPRRPFTQHLEAAAQLTAASPHRLWFPQHPVLTFYADRKLWHSEDGIITRHLAGYPLGELELYRHLPPNLEGVVYISAINFSSALQLFPEFTHTDKVPYWNVHTRPLHPARAP